METNPTVATLIKSKMEQVRCSKRHMSIHAGIPYTTLSRKLANESEFTIGELASIATVLDMKIGGAIKQFIDGEAA